MADSGDPAGEATILVLDLCGFSTRARVFQDRSGDPAAVAALQGRLQNLVDFGLRAAGVHRAEALIQDTGDGALLLLRSPLQAHRCAEAIHRASVAHNTSAATPVEKLAFRIGGATGPVHVRVGVDGSRDHAGEAISTAARLEPLSWPGELLLDERTVAGLPPQLQRRYDPPAAVRGKRTESFLARRCVLQPDCVGEAAGAPAAGPVPDAGPYLGARPFSPGEHHLFFGRTHDLRRVLVLLDHSQVLLLHSASGVGKSSLLHAGVVPALARLGHSVSPVIRFAPFALLGPDVNPFVLAAVSALTRSSGHEDMGEGFSNWAPSTLPDYLAEWRRRRPAAAAPVLVFDQAEELFTLPGRSREERREFVSQVIAALEAEPGLRIVFGIRDDHLGGLERAMEGQPLLLARYRLGALDRGSARNALLGPAARAGAEITGELAEALLDALEEPGEGIDPLQLQVAAERLWRARPAGAVRLEMNLLAALPDAGRPAGHGPDRSGSHRAKEFVADSLRLLVEQATAQVAAEMGATAALVRAGLTLFVSRQRTRQPLEPVDGRVGHLTLETVERLAQAHVLHAGERGERRYFELAHDRLVEPVLLLAERDDVRAVLHALDLLRTRLEQAHTVAGADLKDYFVPHPEVIEEVTRAGEQIRLSPDEVEFLWRAAIAEGRAVTAWSRRLGQDAPGRSARILDEALHHPQPALRRATCRALIRSGVSVQTVPWGRIVALLFDDPDGGVQRAAAEALVASAPAHSLPEIRNRARRYGYWGRGLRGLGALWAACERRPPAAEWHSELLRGMSGALRLQVWLAAKGLRAREAGPALLYTAGPAALGSGLLSSAFKWLPGMFGLGLSMATSGAVVGAFQGLVAGLNWGFLIAAGLTLYRAVSGTGRVSDERPPGWQGMLAGGIPGALAGTISMFLVAKVFAPDSVVKAGWVSERRLPGAAFWGELFFQTRLGWVYPIQGAALGVATAVLAHAVRRAPLWREWQRQNRRLTGLRELSQAGRALVRLAWSRSAPAVGVILAGFTLAWFAVASAPAHLGPLTDPVTLVARLLGDASSQTFGAVGTVAGLLLGEWVLRVGISVEPAEAQDQEA